jgi:phasin family protein
MTHSLPNFDLFFSFGKQNADALAQSSAQVAKAFTDLAHAQQALIARNVERADQAVRALLAAKSAHELAELNSRLLRDSIESAITDGRKLADLGTDAVSAALAPLNARFSAVKAAATQAA